LAHEKFHIQYLVSSPYGDIPPDDDKLDFPLEGDGSGTSYRKYFHSIENFLAQEDFEPLLLAAGKKLGREIPLKEVNRIIIRTEKHGLLYHPASIELILQQEKTKFCLNVAISDLGKVWLQKEISVLKNLHDTFNLPYLPEVYFGGNHNSMLFLLEDWFEGYHEFHITRDEGGGERLKLWEFGNGYKYISPEQSFELYSQASKILTLYYDFQTFKEIHPWHHAAGDFIVKIEDDKNPPIPPLPKGGEGGFSKIDVRLSTARQYEPLLDYTQQINPLLALFYFFLNLSIRMRLDKIDGVGEVICADNTCIKATIAGFFEALKIKEDLDGYPGLAGEFSGLARSFRQDELIDTLKPIVDMYQGSEDLPVIDNNLEKHIEELCATLQNLPLL
jgi:hypothetical protein